MRLEATVRSAALAARCRAGERLEVQGVFSGAVYFSGKGGACLMLHDSCRGSLPFGFAADGLEGHGRGLGAEPGMYAELCAGVLTVPQAGLEIRLRYAPEEDAASACPSREEFSMIRSNAMAALERREASLLPYAEFRESLPAGQTPSDPFAAAGTVGVALLTEALTAADGELCEAALMKLLGLGRGLTPSFDDFVCAAVFTLNYSAKNWGHGAEQAACLSRAVRKLAAGRTGSYSAAYLLAATEGGDISVLRRCLQERDETEHADCIGRLLRVGSSSGTDMLCGLLYALGCLRKTALRMIQ